MVINRISRKSSVLHKIFILAKNLCLVCWLHTKLIREITERDYFPDLSVHMLYGFLGLLFIDIILTIME